jgi:predicted Zn-dependent protease
MASNKRRAIKLAKNGKIAEALAQCEGMSEKERADGTYERTRADVFLYASDYAGAMRELNLLHETSTAKPADDFNLCHASLACHQPAIALTVAQGSLKKLTPESALRKSFLFLVAVSSIQCGDKEKSLEALKDLPLDYSDYVYGVGLVSARDLSQGVVKGSIPKC